MWEKCNINMPIVPYKLLLISSTKPTTPDLIKNSNDMVAWGLWSELSKLKHITMSHQMSHGALNFSPVDFTLMHNYLSVPAVKNIKEVRARTSRRIINCLEAAMTAAQVDYNFTFLPYPDWKKQGFAECETIPYPYLGALLNRNIPVKYPGSILLDHSWEEEDKETTWNDRLYEWLEPLRGLVHVGQMVRPAVKVPPPPGWIEQIPEAGYVEYLERTSPYENYVVTHRESYGHSIIDMLARGIRVLVPAPNGKAFAPSAIVSDMKLPTFCNKESLLKILSDKPACNWRKDYGTDVSEIVRRIDGYCQKELSGGVL